MTRTPQNSTSLAGIPHIDQWFGLWAIEEAAGQALFQQFRGLNLHLHMETRAQEVRAAASEATALELTADGVAIIQIRGALQKQQGSMAAGTSTVLARRQLRAAVADDRVRAIMLYVDSPGGTVAGTEQLAQEVARAASMKPTHAYVDDLCASAAFWIASQAEAISANNTALVGSIGTYGVVRDYSEMFAKEGVKVHVIRAGDFKGSFEPGTEVTESQLADWQQKINGLNDHFVAGIAAGRKLDAQQARGLADGRTHIAAQAKKLGLIDRVESFDAALARVAKQRSPKQEKPKMEVHGVPTTQIAHEHNLHAADSVEATQTATPPAAASPPARVPAASATGSLVAGPASYHEIVAGCPGADANFITSQLAANATLGMAQQAWMAEQNRRLTAAQQQATQAAQQQQAATNKPGVKPLANGAPASEAFSGDAIEAFSAKVREKMAADPKLERMEASTRVAKENPELHKQYLLATNAGSRVAQRLISEKM